MVTLPAGKTENQPYAWLRLRATNGAEAAAYFPDDVIDCHLPFLSAPRDYHNRRANLCQSYGCCLAYTGIPACNDAYLTGHIGT